MGFLFVDSNLTAQEELYSGIDEHLFHYCIAINEFSPANYPIKPSFKWHDPITELPTDFSTFGKKIFNPKSVSTLTGLAILTVLLIPMDHDLTFPLQKEYRHSETFHDVAKRITYIGDGEFHFGIAALFGGAGFLMKDNRAIRTALQIVESEIVTGLTVQVLKRISGRESPQSASRRGGLFRPLPNMADYNRDQTKYYSFPSGHVSTSMAVLTVIAENYPEVKWIRPVGYSLIGLIGVGLMARGWHWLSDYPLAVALGYTFGKIISDRNPLDLEDDINDASLSLQPIMMNGFGIGIIYKF